MMRELVSLKRKKRRLKLTSQLSLNLMLPSSAKISSWAADFYATWQNKPWKKQARADDDPRQKKTRRSGGTGTTSGQWSERFVEWRGSRDVMASLSAGKSYFSFHVLQLVQMQIMGIYFLVVLQSPKTLKLYVQLTLCKQGIDFHGRIDGKIEQSQYGSSIIMDRRQNARWNWSTTVVLFYCLLAKKI